MRCAHFFREQGGLSLARTAKGGQNEGVDADGPMTAAVSPPDDASGRSVAGGMPLKQNRDTSPAA